MKKLIRLTLLTAAIISSYVAHSQDEFCITNADQIAGVQDGYRYELWSQNAQGDACMTIGEGALFSGTWNGILNYLARRGLEYNQTQEHQEVGRFFSTYDCDYNPTTASGNSYLSIYGWTVDPLIEFYIIEDWRNWIPSMAGGATNKGTIEVNGGIYDIVQNTRVNQPSIVGTATFEQYFSIRRDERNSGTINISDHFEKWESLGMDLGKLHEVSFVVEGYQSDGSFAFEELDVFISDGNVLSVDGPNSTEFISVFPNPTSGVATVKLDKSLLGGDVKIYDSIGKVVLIKKDFSEDQINLNKLDSGMYFIEVRKGKINKKTKLMIK